MRWMALAAVLAVAGCGVAGAPLPPNEAAEEERRAAEARESGVLISGSISAGVARSR